MNTEGREATIEDLQSISAGVKYLQDGYIEYAKEVIVGRALPDLRDGLKPVNRRILTTLQRGKSKSGFMKSQKIAGNTMDLHPHGDSAIYQAMVLMTDVNGSLAFPTVKGAGNFGGVYKTDPAGAPRYTEVMLHKNDDEFFGQMNGINMLPNYNSTTTEPEVLPVSFPSVLVNSTSGIAVGFRSNIPSFNFNDVCDLVTEYIKNGECSTVICPDFVTGGYYIKNNKELQKLMRTGTGKIKLRAKTIVDGKDINLTEVPYGKTLQGLLKQINDLNANGVKNAYNTDDFDGAGLTIICTAKNRVDEVLYTLLKDTDLQYSYSADITVIDKGVPTRLGVWQVIEKWVDFRREVLLKEFRVREEACKESMRACSAFMALMSSGEKKDKFVEIVTREGKPAGISYVRENYTREEIPEDLLDWVCGRRLLDYHKGGKYATEFENSKLELASLTENIQNVDSFILADMTRLKATYGCKMPRRTEITQTDYNFVSTEEEQAKVKDISPCVYTFKEGFLRKTKYGLSDNNTQFIINGNANDTLIAFDNRGRVLRVYCEDLPLHGAGDLGVYLPRYFGFNNADENYKITWIGKLDGRELMLLFRDGNVGFVDTSEWVDNNRNVKVIEKGINLSVADKLGAVLTDIPEALLFIDAAGRIAHVGTHTIKHKNRTAKTRVLTPVRGTEIASYYPCSNVEATQALANLGYYTYKLSHLKYADDFRGDEAKIVNFSL